MDVASHDADAVVLGNEERSAFLRTSPLGATLLRSLAGDPDVARLRERARALVGDDVELGPLLQAAREAGLVRAWNGVALPSAPTRGVRLFPRLQRRHLRWLLSPVLLVPVLSLSLLLAALSLLDRADPTLRPDPSAMLFAPTLAASFLATLAVTLVLLAKHELGHLLCARAFGLQGRVWISRRWTVFAAHTDVTAAWTLRPRQRVAIYLAGPATDVVAIALAVALLLRSDLWWDLFPLGGSLLRLVIVVEWIALGFQLLVFLRTDLYYVLCEALREPDLHNRASRALARRHAWRSAPRVVRVYAGVLAAGFAYMVLMLVALGPYLRALVVQGVGSTLAAARGTASPWAFADGAVLLGMFALYASAPVALAVRWVQGRRRRGSLS